MYFWLGTKAKYLTSPSKSCFGYKKFKSTFNHILRNSNGVRLLSNTGTMYSKKVKIQKKLQALQKTPLSIKDSENYVLSLFNKSNGQKDTNYLGRFLQPVTSITVSESINFEQLACTVSPKYEYTTVVPDEVVNITVGDRDLMILSNGTLVGWGFEEKEINDKFLPLVQEALIERCQAESEEMDYIEVEESPNNPGNSGNSHLKGETIIIHGADQNIRLIDKAAFAIGLSRSTRLSVLETSLEKHLQLTRKNSEDLSKGIKITASEASFLKSTGRLFLLRGRLNLYSELIETPDVYWTEPTLEKIYESISRVLDIVPRISILNRKLDYATDEQRALLSVLSEKKSTKLEWIIIILIMVEVCFESFHFYERYSMKDS